MIAKTTRKNKYAYKKNWKKYLIWYKKNFFLKIEKKYNREFIPSNIKRIRGNYL